MARKKNLVLFWSGGKNSALSLFELKCPDYEIVGLITVLDSDNCVQGHAVNKAVIEAQAQSLDLPVLFAKLPAQPSHAQWKDCVSEVIDSKRDEWAIEALGFGDVHLQDLREWKETFAKELGLKAVFPLWKWKASLILQAFSGLGHQAIVHGIHIKKLNPSFLGRPYNQKFVSDLPPGVDGGGENGEFQTCVVAGPFFSSQLALHSEGTLSQGEMLFQELDLNPEGIQGHNREN